MSTPSSSEGRSLRNVESLKQSIQENLRYLIARPSEFISRNDWYLALAYAVRDRIIASWIDAGKAVIQPDKRIVSYLSAEFLVGPHLANNLLNLGMMEEARTALTELGQDFEWIVSQEEEPGSGQRRARAPGGLLSRLSRHPGSAGRRPRHPLRVRHLRPADRRRLAGGDYRRMAPVRQSLGDSAA